MSALLLLARRRRLAPVVRRLPRAAALRMTSRAASRSRGAAWLLLLLSLLALPVGLWGQSAARPPARVIAIVDLALLVDSAPARPAASQQLSRQVQDAERLMQLVGDSLRQAIEVLQLEESRLSPAQREAAMHLLRAREIRFEDMTAQLALAVDRERAMLREPIVASIRAAVRELRAREGWLLVVDRQALGELVEADDAIDVTGRVLTLLRAQAQVPRP